MPRSDRFDRRCAPVPLGRADRDDGRDLSFSISSPLIKWSGDTGSVIAFWRMVGAMLAWWTVMLVVRLRTDRTFPTAATWRTVLPAALFFGANIATFFTAITRTSIAHAEFIAAMSPLLLLPAGAVFFHESPNWQRPALGRRVDRRDDPRAVLRPRQRGRPPWAATS